MTAENKVASAEKASLDTVVAIERMAIERTGLSFNAWCGRNHAERAAVRKQVFALLDECRQDYEGK